jgi:Na+-driven multidrug efflux pump
LALCPGAAADHVHPADIFAFALAYLRVIFVALPATMISVMISMGLRGAGDAKTSLYFMIVSVVLDCGLNPVFIAGLGPFRRWALPARRWPRRFRPMSRCWCW